MPDGVHDADNTELVTRAWAKAILTNIEDPHLRYENQDFCDLEGFKKYVYRHNAATHFLQDKTVPSHAVGNEDCNPNGYIFGFFTGGPRRCRAKLAEYHLRSNLAYGKYHPENKLYCDDDVVDYSVPGEGGLNANMLSMENVCSGFWSLVLPDTIVNFACAGLERTIRHHCNVNAPSLLCSGPGDEHGNPLDGCGDVVTSEGNTTNKFYCEGERCPFGGVGGDDFMSAAESASLTATKAAASEWATICGIPQSPCLPDKCQTFCERYTRFDRIWSGYGMRAMGYCVKEGCDPLATVDSCWCGNGQVIPSVWAPWSPAGDFHHPSYSQACGLPTGGGPPGSGMGMPCCRSDSTYAGYIDGCWPGNSTDPPQYVCNATTKLCGAAPGVDSCPPGTPGYPCGM